MDKGVSPILASVLIVLVAISLSGAFLIFTQSTSTQLTETGDESVQSFGEDLDVRFAVESVSGNRVFVRNAGDANITHGSVRIFVDDILLNHTVPSVIEQGEIGTVHINNTWRTSPGRRTLRVAGGATSDSVLVEVSPPEGSVVDLRMDETGGISGTGAIQNTGFEEPRTGDDWQEDSDVTIEYQSDVVLTGSQAASLTAQADTDPWEELINHFSLEGGKSYYAEAWVKTDGQTTPRLLVQNNDDGTQLLSMKPGPVTEWTKLSGTFYLPSTSNVYVGLRWDGTPDEGDTMYWDDVVLEEFRAEDTSGSGNHWDVRPSNGEGPGIGVDATHNTAYNFSEASQRLHLAEPANPPGDSITVTTRVNVPGHGDWWNYVRNEWSSSVPGSWLLFSDGDGRAIFGVRDDSGSQVTARSSTGAFNPGEWTHLAGTYDGTDVKIYVDGELVDTNNHPGLSLSTDTAWDIMPSHPSAGSAYVDEVRVFNRALTAEEIVSVVDEPYTVNG